MDIARKAKFLFRKYNTNCPLKISEQLKINVLFLDLPEHVKGYCHYVLKRKFIILNQSLSEHEIRYVCAHELGHLLLHPGYSHYFITNHTHFVKSRFEREAHKFAIRLILTGYEMNTDDTLQWVFQKNGIPEDMVIYY